jgi:methyl-accepting chemotaxis protein
MRTATDGSIATINGIRAAIGSVDHLTAHVASAVEAQHATMRGIVQAAGESATVATEVSAAMQAVLADASEAALSVDNLRGVAAEIAVQGGVLEAELEKVVEELRAA